jgi:hypothetical protein
MMICSTALHAQQCMPTSQEKQGKTPLHGQQQQLLP